MGNKEALQLFREKRIRTAWNQEEEKWYFSIVDVVEVLTNSPDAKRYWSVLKVRLKKEGVEPTTICSTLKLRAADGKMRQTEARICKVYFDNCKVCITFAKKTML